MPRCPVVGETWLIEGRQTTHPQYGPQVIVTSGRLCRPSGRNIIGMLSGPSFSEVGVITATKLWTRFGDDLYRILSEGDQASILEVTGETARGKRQADKLISGWQALEIEHEVIAWLDQNGISPKLGAKIAACYGADAIPRLEEDPFRLLLVGGSWTEVDSFAQGLGVSPDDQRRLSAAVEQCIHGRFLLGDTSVSPMNLTSDLSKIIGTPLAPSAIKAALDDRSLVEMANGLQGHGPAAIESYVADDLCRRLRAGQISLVNDLAARLDIWERANQLTLNVGQRSAVAIALEKRVALICGGAGTGKTKVLQAIGDLAEQEDWSVIQLALSGRAALRISESTGRTASTIASFLAQSVHQKPNGRCLMIIDEASMVDVVQLYRLLAVLHADDRILLVGDVAQLPPIGPGLTLHALAEMNAVPQVQLTEIMRQAAETGIPQAAKSIREGIIPAILSQGSGDGGVQFVACERAGIAHAIMRLRDQEKDRVQVIGAFKGKTDTDGGVRAINSIHHARVESRTGRKDSFQAGEPVIWTRNDHDLQLLNGELGMVLGPTADGALEVEFSSRSISLQRDQLRDLALAYAITVHKAQGSDFATVIIPIVQHILLDRAMVYTALTRAKRKVIFVGDRVALQQAISADSVSARCHTGLAWHFQRIFASCDLLQAV